MLYSQKRALITLITNSVGLSYKEENKPMKEFTPCTDGKTIFMPKMPHSTTSDEATIWWYTLCHESLHNAGDNKLDFTYMKDKDINMRSLYGNILNLVVDFNIEHKGYGMYEGRDKWLIAGRNLATKTLIQTGISNRKEEDNSDITYKIDALFAYDAERRGDWCITMSQRVSIGTEANLWLDKLNGSESLREAYMAKRSGGEPNALVTDLICEILEIDKEEAQKAPEECKIPCAGPAVTRFKDINFHNHTDGDRKAGTTAYPLTITYESDDTSDLYDYRVPNVKVVRPVGHHDGNYDCGGTALTRKVESLLKTYSQPYKDPHQRQGRINIKSVIRRKTSNDLTKDNVYFKKKERLVKDTAVCMLIDQSGSMSGADIRNAKDAAIRMHKCLSQINVTHSIEGFTTGSGGVLHYIHEDTDWLDTLPEEHSINLDWDDV